MFKSLKKELTSDIAGNIKMLVKIKVNIGFYTKDIGYSPAMYKEIKFVKQF